MFEDVSVGKPVEIVSKSAKRQPIVRKGFAITKSLQQVFADQAKVFFKIHASPDHSVFDAERTSRSAYCIATRG